MRYWRQLAIRSLLTCVSAAISLLGLTHPFPPFLRPVVPLPFHFLHRIWFSVDDWKVWPRKENWGTTPFLSSGHFPSLRLLHFFCNIFLTAFLLACMLNSRFLRHHKDKRKKSFDLYCHLYVKMYILPTSYSLGWLLPQTQIIPSVVKDVGKLELSYIVDRNVNSAAAVEKSDSTSKN